MTYFVTNALLRESHPRPPWAKVVFNPSCFATCSKMRAASFRTCWTSGLVEMDDRVEAIANAEVTFLTASRLGEGGELMPGTRIPSTNSTARTVWTKFFSTIIAMKWVNCLSNMKRTFPKSGSQVGIHDGLVYGLQCCHRTEVGIEVRESRHHSCPDEGTVVIMRCLCKN